MGLIRNALFNVGLYKVIRCIAFLFWFREAMYSGYNIHAAVLVPEATNPATKSRYLSCAPSHRLHLVHPRIYTTPPHPPRKGYCGCQKHKLRYPYLHTHTHTHTHAPHIAPLLQTLDRNFHHVCVRHKHFIKDPFSFIGRPVTQNSPSFTHYLFLRLFPLTFPTNTHRFLLYALWLAALYYAANPLISDCNIIFNLCFIYALFFLNTART
jgi:hypothetical protein